MGSKNKDNKNNCLRCDAVIEFCRCNSHTTKQNHSKCIEQKATQSQGNLEQEFGDQEMGQTQGDQLQEQSQGFGDQDLDQTQGDQQQEQSQGFGDQDLDQTQGDQLQQQSQGFGDQDLDQTQGDQLQQQSQGFGDQDLDQTQGDQQQQQSQAHGDQGQTQGDQSQNQGHDQLQAQGAQTQDQEHGDQTNGNQTNEGHTNTSPLDNSQSISTPVDVDGVTVNVKCGDSIQIPFPLFQPICPKCNEHDRDDQCDKKCFKKKDLCKKGCCDCLDCLCGLLEDVEEFQSTIVDPVDKQIDLYFSVPSTLANPTEDQVITDVNDCSIVRFKDADQPSVIPSTTVQLCDVAGISATDSGNTPDIFEFLLQRAREKSDSCKQHCDCSGCANGIGEELAATARFGLEIMLSIKGVTTALPPLFVISVKDCIVYLVNNLEDPAEIYAFTLCSVTGLTVTSQTI